MIGHAVSLCPIPGLSLRDVELIQAERGIGVTDESARQRCLGAGAPLCSPEDGSELWPKLGDGGVRKAAYRGG